MLHNSSLRGLLLLVSLGVSHCGVTVGPGPEGSDAAVSDAVVSEGSIVAPPSETASCEAVQATCATAPAQFFRASATGLTGLDGAAVQVAVRYLREQGNGLAVPHDVVTARTTMRAGGFEACVCIPRNANVYPQVAAVVFAPGSRSETGASVARGFFSQRYAVVGPEDVSYLLREPPTPAVAEAALAAMSDRSAETTVRGLDASFEGVQAYGGLVADERRIASQLSGALVTGSNLQFAWNMPGRSWPSERLVFVLDANRNRVCDVGDVGASVLPSASSVVQVSAESLVRGSAVTALCEAIAPSVSRE